MAYNSAKKLYVVHNRKEHNYLGIRDTKYEMLDFCECKLFKNIEDARVQAHEWVHFLI